MPEENRGLLVAASNCQLIGMDAPSTRPCISGVYRLRMPMIDPYPVYILLGIPRPSSALNCYTKNIDFFLKKKSLQHSALRSAVKNTLSILL